MNTCEQSPSVAFQPALIDLQIARIVKVSASCQHGSHSWKLTANSRADIAQVIINIMLLFLFYLSKQVYFFTYKKHERHFPMRKSKYILHLLGVMKFRNLELLYPALHSTTFKSKNAFLFHVSAFQIFDVFKIYIVCCN